MLAVCLRPVRDRESPVHLPKAYPARVKAQLQSSRNRLGNAFPRTMLHKGHDLRFETPIVRRMSCRVVRQRPCIVLAIRLGDLLYRLQRLADHPGEGGDLSSQDERLSRVSTVFQSVPVASRSPASGPVHPADTMSPNGGRAALDPAPLRSGVASRRPAHIQEHGVVPSLFRLPLPPVPGC
jgi:hypothetical protein